MHWNEGEWWEIMVKTSATSDIGHLTKSYKKKKKMNNLTVWWLSVSRCSDAC